MCLVRRVRAKSPSTSGALQPWLQWAWLLVSYFIKQVWFELCKGREKEEDLQPLSLCRVSVSTRTHYKSSVYRLVDSKANFSGPLNKSVPKYNASTSTFSSDTWQFNLKSNWSCLWTSANTVWGGWTIYWFRLIFARNIWDRYSTRCHTLYILHSSRPSTGIEAGIKSMPR